MGPASPLHGIRNVRAGVPALLSRTSFCVRSISCIAFSFVYRLCDRTLLGVTAYSHPAASDCIERATVFPGCLPRRRRRVLRKFPPEDQFTRNSLRLGVCLYPGKSSATPVPRDESEICSRANWRTLIFMSCNMSSMCLARELMRFAGSSLRPSRHQLHRRARQRNGDGRPDSAPVRYFR